MSSRRHGTGVPLKARISPTNGSEGSQARKLQKYPDTGETGDTYDLEFEETAPQATSKEAAEKAAEFLRKHGMQGPSADKFNR